jgi:hypothetical protein
MFRFQNLKQKFGRFSYFGNYVNSFQILNLAKHDIYPHSEKEIMKNVPTNLIVNSGKIIINLKKFDKNSKLLKQKTLFAENDILYRTEQDHDLIITNQKYILTIAPSVFYSFYSYDNNTNFQLFYKSDDSIRYYTHQTNNNYSVSSIEYLN